MFSPTATYWFAAAVLAAFAATIVTAAVRLLFRSRYTLIQGLLYSYAYVMARVLWRAELPDTRLRPHGGAVIVCNHRGPFDPVFIQLIAGRVVHWMVAGEYVQHPMLRWFFRITQSIPVSRGGIDTAATKSAIRHAQTGALVGMFPEGRLNTTERLLLSGRPGAALVALRAEVPVVPCYLSGVPVAESILATLFQPAHAVLKIGPPIDTSPYLDHAKERDAQIELTKTLMREIARLAGQNDFQPELAPRRWKPDDNGSSGA